MDNHKCTVIIRYEELKCSRDRLDNECNHILVKSLPSKCEDAELVKSISEYVRAEVSLFVENHCQLSRLVYEYCIQNRIILYCDIEDDFILKDYRQCERVVFGSTDMISKLSNRGLKLIVDSEVNVCLVNPCGNIQEINIIYSSLLQIGFCKLFSILSLSDNEKYSCGNTGLIGRNALEQFSIQNNFQAKEQIDQIKKNVLHRFNRLQSEKTNCSIKVILVNINVATNNENRKNLGIEYLAAVLNQNGYSAMCLYSSRFTFIQDIESILKEQSDVRVVGFSCMEDNLHSVENAIAYLNKEHSHIITTIGGAQALALTESFMRNVPVDYIMVGESEYSYLDLIKNIIESQKELKHIKNLRFISEKNEYVETPRGELIQNLDNIPFPEYVYHKDDNLVMAGIITGRGCPFSCAFCYEGAKEKTVRFRSLQNVFNEISLLVKNKANLKHIQFYDDTFTVDADRVREFCRKYSEIYEKYKISWTCEIHCQTVCNSPQLIENMVKSGLSSAQIGIESGDVSTLRKLSKQTTPEQIMQTVKNCKSAGLSRLEGNIILGAVKESRFQLEEQFDFVDRLITCGRGMFELGLVMFWPFFNTPISLNPSKFGITILDKQCQKTMNCLHNFVTESELVSRNEYIEHYHKLVEWTAKIYEREVLKMKAAEVILYWKTYGLNHRSQWGRALMKYSYIQNYLFAASKTNTNFSDINVCPVRTFNLLTYRSGCLYLKEATYQFGKLDSAILELCNGKNTILQIADQLKYDVMLVQRRLKGLSEQMFVYGVNI